MSKKKILDYNPKTGFGNFAEIMNANNAIDMAQNRVNMPSAPITPTPVAPTQAASAIQNQTPPLTDAVNATVGQQNGGIPDATNTQTTVPQIPNDPDTGSVSTPATDPSATLSPTQTVGTTQIVGGKKGYEEWMTANGFDPDTEYDNARAALEYDYQTSMATYGRRAEELAQMGLSNSGISDVYQLGAFNTYLANQNALANQKIAAKKKSRQDYEAYVNAFNAQEEAEIGNAATALIQSNYTQDRENSVRDLYRARGWSEEKIDKLIGQLNAYSSAFNNKIQDAYFSIIDNKAYDPDAKDTLWKRYEEAGWTRAEFDKLIGKLDDYYGTAAGETIDKVVNEDTGAVTVDQMLESLNNVAQSVGKDSESYIAEQEKISGKISETIKWALDDIDNNQIPTIFGIDESEWDKMDEGERENALIIEAGEMVKSGYLDSEKYGQFVADAVDEEINSFIEKDIDNATATGLQDAGGLVYKLKEYKDAKYLTDDQYHSLIKDVINKMGFKQPGKNSQINWYSTVNGSEATIDIIPGWTGTGFGKVKDDTAFGAYNDGVKKMHTWSYGYDIYSHNGKLYAYRDGIIEVVEPYNIFVQGDGVTNNDKQKEGIYELLVVFLENEKN